MALRTAGAYLWRMTLRPTALERAFALARSGTCASVSDIRKQLKEEGLSDRDLEGPSLLRQLRALCAEAAAAKVE